MMRTLPHRQPPAGNRGFFTVRNAVSAICGALCVIRYGLCFAGPVASAELINNARQYDGRTIVYQGEAIGDVMARGAHAWININDGKNAIGCWVPLELTRDISYTGSYRSKGDVVEVIGVFNRACVMHGGDLDLHGQVVHIVAQGYSYLEAPSQKKIYLALLLLGLLCLVLIWSQLKHRPAKK